MSEQFNTLDYVERSLINWVKKKIIQLDVDEDILMNLWKKEHELVLATWLFPENPYQYLYVILEERKNSQYRLYVQITPDFADKNPSRFIYFMKDEDSEVSSDSIDELVAYGSIRGGHVLDSLLDIVKQKFAPHLLAKTEWAESIRKDFASQLHKFLASLTETANRLKGSTVLYIPNEHINSVHEARKKKDLLQRLESALVKWISQIKEVVDEKDTIDHHEGASPMSEINYWKSRTLDLQKLKKQLESSEVKTILDVLESSSYMKSFRKYAALIQKGYDNAKDNLTFLSTLKDSCFRLSKAVPREIPIIIPEILKKIMLIWNLSNNYHNKERISGLLKKVSNEIIHRCMCYVSEDEILFGDVTIGIKKLRECISSCRRWHKICTQMFKKLQHNREKLPNKQRVFQYDEEGVFEEVFAFTYRCNDLIDVCKAELQLGNKLPLPAFSGTKGPEITKSLKEIRAEFEKSLDKLRGLDYKLMNVKSARWHDDFGSFKNDVRDLELIMENVLNSAFESVRTVRDGVELLEAFSYLAKRDHVRNVIQLKTKELYQFFFKKMEGVQQIFDMKNKDPPIPEHLPKRAGAALWANELRMRIMQDKHWIDSAYFLVTKDLKSEKLALDKRYERLFNTTLYNYMRQSYQEWIRSLYLSELTKMKEQPILRRTKDKLLVLNFDPRMILVFKEYYHWEKIPGFEPPHELLEAVGDSEQVERLRVHMENVNMVIRQYNNIMISLSEDYEEDEKGQKSTIVSDLFQESILNLNKKISKCVQKVTWNMQKYIGYFVPELTQICKNVGQQIGVFSKLRYQIISKCNEISNTLLVEIDPKIAYQDSKFAKTQLDHRRAMKVKLRTINDEIIEMMKEMYVIFRRDSEDVQVVWWRYVRRIEKRIENSLRTCLKRSFHRLSEAINGDMTKTSDSQAPLFYVYVELTKSELEQRKPILKPSVKDLEGLVHSTHSEIMNCINVVVCLEPSLKRAIEEERVLMEVVDEEEEEEIEDAEKEGEGEEIQTTTTPIKKNKEKLPNYWDVISKEEKKFSDEFKDPMVAAYHGIRNIQGQVEEHINEKWTSQYHDLWMYTRESLTKRLMYRDRHIRQFKDRYEEFSFYAASVRSRIANFVMGYLHMDFSRLKNQIEEDASYMMKTVLEVLHTQAKKGLDEVYDIIETNMVLLKEEILDRDVLKKKIELLAKCKEYVHREGDADLKEGETNPNKSNLELRFEPVKSYYNVLRKYLSKKYENKIVLTEEELERLNKLEEVGGHFQESVLLAEKYVSDKKTEFKAKLLRQIESFENSISTIRNELFDKGPKDAKFTVERAQLIIRDYRKRLNQRLRTQESLREGCRMFNIPFKNYKIIKEIEKMLDILDKMWNLKKNWDASWLEWKVCVFRQLDMTDIETKAGDYIRTLNTLARDCENWGVWVYLQTQLLKFRNTLHLLIDLKDEAMRPRHWEDLHRYIHKEFDHNDESFNLERILQLNFESYSEDIRTIAHKARQELSIEKGIEKVISRWDTIPITIIPYKVTCYEIKEVDDIFQFIDEDSSSLSVMKISPFIAHFKETVIQWERDLSNLSEILEKLIQLQELWKYLKNIFIVDDIKKQLYGESIDFRKVDRQWKAVLEEMIEVKTVFRASKRGGLMTEIMGMVEELEAIQKELNDFLETKRQEFPRFYFLSDRDLLEILGMSKDPESVQRHLQNCFAGIFRLHIEKESQRGRPGKCFVARGLRSKEGEDLTLSKPVLLEGPVEKWLFEVERGMKYSVRKHLKSCHTELLRKKRAPRDKWVEQFAGQLTILSAQIFWTRRVEEKLRAIQSGKSKRGMRDLVRQWDRLLRRYISMIQKDLDLTTREKLVALITIEVHHKEVIENLLKTGVKSIEDFAWERQLRFYLHDDVCKISQTAANIDYDNEYIGPCSRLVITPLTERCYMTLTTAVHLSRGGNPKGPAGTGKTESVKDLARAIGKYCIVFNCSEGLDIGSMARMFSGLVQTGAWSCFDEFNRIGIEVLSVVAQHISLIIQAIISKNDHFEFEGSAIRINRTCGIFCTMNPGYAGRTELPDNLKSLLRPIAMMRADRSLICKILLYAQGFNEGPQLSKKIVTLFSLMSQQLSKQKHYDFGLRAIKAVLTSAGELKRNPEYSSMSEEAILYQACRDMNLPKFVAGDLPLFRNLLEKDLFPEVDHQENSFELLENKLRHVLMLKGLQDHPYIIKKAVQLYETKKTRHGCMVVGRTCSGKTTTWKALKLALNELAVEEGKEDIPREKRRFFKVHEFIINPKSLENDELYGFYNKAREWKNGVVSVIMKDAFNDPRPDLKWIVFDGPVDTLWIESMNTVLDDTKTLTLISGDRIRLKENVSLLFEVKDLQVASPATVSRCGMIFFDETQLGWIPFYTTWCTKKIAKSPENMHAKLKTLYFTTFLNWIKRSLLVLELCNELITTNEVNLVRSLCYLFNGLAVEENGLHEKEENYYEVMTKFFVFSMIWAIGGGSVDDEGRKKLDMLFREFDPNFPSKETVFEYFIDENTSNWRLWSDLIQKSWNPPENVEFYEVMVPTIDTQRYSFILKSLIRTNRHVLVIGNVGVGKTSIVKYVLRQLPEDKISNTTINFSARTTSSKLQTMIESKVDKRSVDTWGPKSSQKLVLFVDDFNMPMKDEYGSQPPLELLRQWMEHGFWYDRQSQHRKKIVNVRLLAAMGPPGGGREEISERLQSRFNLLNITMHSRPQLYRIYSTLLKHKLDHLEEFKPLIDSVVNSSIDVYEFVNKRFRPTPKKSHYVFNMRDLAKVFNGIFMADHDAMDNIDQMKRLWVHECFRVLHDRLNDDDDREAFKSNIVDKLLQNFATRWTTLFGRDHPKEVPFGIVLKDTYQEMRDEQKLKDIIGKRLIQRNQEIGMKPMNLVMFRDAVDHVCRISRILRQPKGHALLIGVGGSGRSSLTRLAAYICNMEVFEIEVSSDFTVANYHESLKTLYKFCGFQGKEMVYLVNDSQFKEDVFLEDINNMLSSGEVPNLFENEEMDELHQSLKMEAAEFVKNPESPQEVYEFFLQKVRNRLHVVVCMSPLGDSFRGRLRQFPALVNCTTIDWFSEWPESALNEVSVNILDEEKDKLFRNVVLNPLSAEMKAKMREEKKKRKKSVLLTEEEETEGEGEQEEEEEEEESKIPLVDRVVNHVSRSFVQMHYAVKIETEKLFEELKRYNFVTPTNYLELVNGYASLLREKKLEVEIEQQKLQGGVNILRKAEEEVNQMSVDLAKQKDFAAQKDLECANLMREILREQEEMKLKKDKMDEETEEMEKEQRKMKQLQEETARELAKVAPDLKRAKDNIDEIKASDVFILRTMQNPPPGVRLALKGVMAVLGRTQNYDEARKEMNKPSKFLKKLKEFNHLGMTEGVVKKLRPYVKNPKFQPHEVAHSSTAARDLCEWVIASEMFGRTWLTIKPIKRKAEEAKMKFERANEKLRKQREELDELERKLKTKSDELENKRAERKRIIDLKKETEEKLQLAKKLVSSLKDEGHRWEEQIAELSLNMKHLCGDVLMASAFLAYCGPFPREYRSRMLQIWRIIIERERIPLSPDFNTTKFLTTEIDLQTWIIQGLPSDDFSAENAAIVMRGRRWPLTIDPQGQANKWIRNLEGEDLIVTSFNKDDFQMNLESAIQGGRSVLIEDVSEEIDPSYYGVIGKDLFKKGGRNFVKIGDRELEFAPNFKLFMTTKLVNPRFPTEIFTRTSICNFSVTKTGLIEQLLGTLVREEDPKLEKDKQEAITVLADCQRKKKKLEDDILNTLTEEYQKKNLLSKRVIDLLELSKKNSEEITKKMKDSRVLQKKTNDRRKRYRDAAVRSSLLYFVLCDLSKIDPMYQFSLENYIELFKYSIGKAEKPRRRKIEKRVENINDFHTKEVYRRTCQALFEKHKLLFSFQMCAQIEIEKRKMDVDMNDGIDVEEYNFFLRGGVTFDTEDHMTKSIELDWLSEEGWINFLYLNRIKSNPKFHGIIQNLEDVPQDWEDWFMSPEPENVPLPSEFETKIKNFWERMLIVRCCRLDRFVHVVKQFIMERMGDELFITPPTTQLELVCKGTTPFTPIVFILSRGVDPTDNLFNLSRKKNMKLRECALGQNQEKTAIKLIQTAAAMGEWVFLANCHLMISWMPHLEKLIDLLPEMYPQENFRLWLSSKPHPKFPISILQRSRKLTMEPSTGLRQNMKRLHHRILESMTEQEFDTLDVGLRKSLFALTFYHSVLMERAKFGTLGWNVIYDFNDSDFTISKDILNEYLLQKSEVNWSAIRFLIGEISYGGRVTDDVDRKLLSIYTNLAFNKSMVEEVSHVLTTDIARYRIPATTNLTLSKVLKYIEGPMFPRNDLPIAFGQHANADISSQIQLAQSLLELLNDMNPHKMMIALGGGDGDEFDEMLKTGDEDEESAVTPESEVLKISLALLEELPKLINLEATQDDTSAMTTVLIQESERYNYLLRSIRLWLEKLVRALRGDIGMDQDLELIFNDISEGKVPKMWLKTYPSVKNLMNWRKDLQRRVRQMKHWAEGEMPRKFWLGGFIFPSGFLTALKQKAAREKKVSVDSLQFEFHVEQNGVTSAPKEGAYIDGLILEGAGWDEIAVSLAEPEAMKLTKDLPPVLFKPKVMTAKERKKMGVLAETSNLYPCPVYVYPKRGRESFVVFMDLKMAEGTKTDHWVKRGTAILLSDEKHREGN